jgi:hypothetical protein
MAYFILIIWSTVFVGFGCGDWGLGFIAGCVMAIVMAIGQPEGN